MVVKRLADWLEKISVAGLAVGLFQLNQIGIVTGVFAFLVSILLTIYIEKKETK
ncbi:hypothetical protein FACS1894103_3830 [Campylobacterota bacterium]|nr:hypothetical protein FACS1894103_3830 [Campylobacterota bacterium]